MTARSIAVLLAVPRAAIGQRTLTFMAVGTLLAVTLLALAMSARANEVCIVADPSGTRCPYGFRRWLLSWFAGRKSQEFFLWFP
jgi:hypothetical protein